MAPRNPPQSSAVVEVEGLGNPPQTSADPSGEGVDNPQEDWGPPVEAAHGANHTRRPDRTEAMRGQGKLTVQRNKEIVKGRLFRS